MLQNYLNASLLSLTDDEDFKKLKKSADWMFNFYNGYFAGGMVTLPEFGNDYLLNK